MEPLSVVRKWVAPYVGESGKNESDPEVLEAINEARRIIYPVGDWREIIEPLVIDVQQGTITLPSWADTIRQAWIGRERVDIENQWYMPLHDGFDRFCHHGIQLIDLGTRFATFKPYDKDKTFRIKVKSLDARDEGKQLTFHGVSEYGEPVLLTRTLGKPWVSITADPINDKWVRSITACNKPLTVDRIFVYMYDPVRGNEYLCAIYEATDINPQLRRYRVPRGCSRQVFAKVKKKFVELVHDNELVDIHTDALIHLLQGITHRKNRDAAGYGTEIGAAKNFLDRELYDGQPMQTFQMRMAPEFHETQLGFEGGGRCDQY